MAYIGKEPADSFISFAKQDFSTSATTSYTLDNAVTNENELALFINFVRQEPTTAYTASGTTLTLQSATASGDDMYCVYLGQAKQTVNAPDGSVGNSQVASTIITGQTAETSIATDDTVLIHDTSAGALRKMTRANFVSGVGGTNTPAFLAKYANVVSSISENALTKLTGFDTEIYDTDNTFASNKFTPGGAGKYFLYGAVSYYSSSTGESAYVAIYKNGSVLGYVQDFFGSGVIKANTTNTIEWSISDIADDDDYYEIYFYQNNTGNNTYNIYGDSNMYTWFGAYKLIGV